MNTISKLNSSILARILALSCLLLPISYSSGGIVSVKDRRGQCKQDYANFPYPLSWTEFNTFFYSGQSSNGDFYVVQQYDLLGTRFDGAVLFCAESVEVVYRNEPDGPSIEQLRREMTKELLLQIINRKRNFIGPQQPTPPPPFFHPLGFYGRQRASLDKRFIGINLTEASPSWAIRHAFLSQTNVLAGEAVHFIVESNGQEDWIELAVNGVAFMKLSLNMFKVGQYYEIDVPSGLLVEGMNSYSYFLNSTGPANSKVFFPLSLPEDARPTIGSSSRTNSVLTLQLASLVDGFDYSIQQSSLATTNWQSVASFTATNDHHSFSVPMTSSAMFYRVALLPPL